MSSLCAACASVRKLHNKLFASAKLRICLHVRTVTLPLEQENMVNDMVEAHCYVVITSESVVMRICDYICG